MVINGKQGSFHASGFSLEYLVVDKNNTTATATQKPFTLLVVGSARYYARTFSKDLQEHCRMVFIDHRGFAKGPSEFAQADFELPVLVDDIEALRLHLGLERCVVVGHSGHGHMALQYARKYPAAVLGVVVLAMSPQSNAASFKAADQYFAESVCPERQQAFAANMALLGQKISADPARAFVLYTLASGPRTWFDHQFDAAELWQGVHVNQQVFDYIWGKVSADIDTAGTLQALTQPMFLGLGRYDYWNPPHLWEPLRGVFGDVTLRVFERSGHTPQLEEATLFNRELLGWCRVKLSL